MAIRTYKVTLDSKNTIAPEPVYLRQGDKTGAVVIDATLMDNGAPVSLDGLTPMFKANTADGQAVVIDSTGFNIVNASGGEFTYQVPSQLGSVDGKIKIAYFSFSDSSGSESTFNVVFVVEKAADMTKESAKDWVSNLNEIIDQYNQWVNSAHSSWAEFVDANKEIIESIDPGGTLLTEVIAARNGKSNLKTRLDDEHAQVTEQLAQTLTLVSKNEGSLDDTLQIQNAINSASTGNGFVKLLKGKTYIVGSLSPKENVTIDLNGSTLKLKDQTELPLFYDYATANDPKRKNFSVINGVLDGNMQNNQAGNQSAGVFWLTDWDGLFFDKLVIKNALRNIFNFFRCHNIGIPNAILEGNGMTNPNNFYSYGATFEHGCKNIKIGNLVVKDMYGFGIHFNNVEDYQADNLTFINLTHPSAIAITFTQAKRGVINNISCDGVLGDSIEINATQDLEIKNLLVSGSGKRSIIYGDNGTGDFNERVNLGNVKTTNTGSSESISVTWAKNCEINHADFDKGLGTLANKVVENFRFVDTKFNIPLSAIFLYYSKFNFINTTFTDVILQRVENTIFEIGNVGNRIFVNDAEVVEIPFANFNKGGMIGGKLQVISYMPGTEQGTYQEIGFIQFGSTFNLLENLSVDGSYKRKLTVTADAANKKIILTNSTGQTLTTKWNVIGQ